MTDKEIIEASLNFLVTDYGFTYEYDTPNGNAEYYKFKNKNGCFTYYQWAQFGEYEFSVICNQEFKEIRLFERYPKIIASFNKEHKGIKWFFKDKRKDYWKMIAGIIKIEIDSNDSLFGIKFS